MWLEFIWKGVIKEEGSSATASLDGCNGCNRGKEVWQRIRSTDVTDGSKKQ
ncbi:hypothetical protein [Microcoleus vaginatus]|uniref:hypothetical protein n=1 Tax=Microcoleus vaginatus TaxID=119532 RepID=UPI0016826EAE|nr:hypothetical protein [Microcoleus sp. FACHB-84]MBD2008129.1 hypothetical protein [Microcoleus sp. FACHB-45]